MVSTSLLEVTDVASAGRVGLADLEVQPHGTTTTQITMQGRTSPRRAPIAEQSARGLSAVCAHSDNRNVAPDIRPSPSGTVPGQAVQVTGCPGDRRHSMRRRTGISVVSLVLGLLVLAPTASTAQTNGPGTNASSSPPDLTHPSRPAIGADNPPKPRLPLFGVAAPLVVDPAVNNTVPNFKDTDATGGTEPSVALNPANPQQLVMTSFSGSWGANAPLWYSNDGGQTWTKEFTIPAPPGRPAGCPCDQNVDYGRNGTLFGTFLIPAPSPPANRFDVVSGSTTDPTMASSWQWNGNPAQLTNNAHPGNADQPWMLVNRDPATASQDDVFAAYDEFTANNAQVAVSKNAAPPNFTVDNSAGSESPQDFTNPGLRLGKDTRNGTMYALWQTAIAKAGNASPHTTTLHLNRTADAGSTWTLNGSGSGITIGPFSQDDYDFKFGTVNALRGGVDHVAVDPTNGDVYVVYGRDTTASGNGNQIYLDRYVDNGSGGLTQAGGYPKTVSSATSAALPSVAVTADGTVGVLYDTDDGTSGPPGNFPKFSAHLATSTNQGGAFSDSVLETFLSPQVSDGAGTGQRVLGDYQQLKSDGHLLYGVFSGNRVPFGGTTSIIDPVFFSQYSPGAANSTTTVTSSANPSVVGQAVTFTAQVAPVPPATGTPLGTVQFTVDGIPDGGPVPLSPAPGGAQAASPPFTFTSAGNHNVTASYSGDTNLKPSQGSLTQIVAKASPSITTQASPGNLLGAPVRDVATLTGGFNPAGTVTFRLFSDNTCATQVFTSTNPVGGLTASSDWFTPAAVGTYYWTALYNGDANNNTDNSSCNAPNESVVIAPFVPPPFTRIITGDLVGPVTVNAGESVQIINARVVGPVTVNPGGALTVVNSQISRGVAANAPGFLSVCGSQVSGPSPGQALGVSNAGVPIRIGDPANGCAGNRFAGDVNLTANLAVTFGANIVSQNVNVNSGGPGNTILKANSLFSTLACSGNNPPPTNAGQPNTAANKTGQCSAL